MVKITKRDWLALRKQNRDVLNELISLREIIGVPIEERRERSKKMIAFWEKRLSRTFDSYGFCLNCQERTRITYSGVCSKCGERNTSFVGVLRK